MRLRSLFLHACLAIVATGLVACEKAPTRDAAEPAAAPAPTAAGAKPAPGMLPGSTLVAGRDYIEIPDGKPFDAVPGKVEVVEVFGYTCPHCAQFEPSLRAWLAQQPAGVHFVPLAAPFGDYWTPYAKAFYAARELGVAEKTHEAVFRAIHEQRTLPAPPQVASSREIAAFYARHGVDAATFERTMEGPAVKAQIERAMQFIQRSGVNGTPMLVVDGRYQVGGATSEDVLRNAAQLVAYRRAALKGTP